MRFNTNLKAPDKLISKDICVKKRIILVDSEFLVLNEYYNSFGLVDKAPNVTIDRDGLIYEHTPSIYTTKYYKDKVLNSSSIIISLMNAGKLSQKDNTYVNWLNQKVDNNVTEFLWRKCKFWEPYTKLQVDSLYNLCKYYHSIYNFPFEMSYEDGMTYEGAFDRFGIVTESNLFKESTQLNPTFDIDFLKYPEPVILFE